VKPSTTPKVSVLVVSWNGRRHLETCLEALAAQDDPGVPWEVVVVDNGSRDGTVPWLEAEHPEVRVVAHPVNAGFTGGNRLAVEASRGQWVVLLNNDTRPEPGWLRALVSAMEGAPGDVAAISGLIVDWDADRLDFGRGVMTFDAHAFQLDFRRPLGRARLPAAGEELLFGCGGNVLLRKASFEAAGGFDDDYFAYLEDVDLGWRLWSGGERVLCAPDAVVRHRSSATSDLLGSFNRGFLFERNAFLTAYKNYQPGLWERVMPAVQLTFAHRTQTLLVHHNPGAATLATDPYGGQIADTGRREAPLAPPAFPELDLHPDWRDPRRWPGRLLERLEELGPGELLRRGWGRLTGRPPALPLPPPVQGAGGPEPPRLTDPRTLAQLRAQSYLLRHLDAAAAKRERIQARRKRGDDEIFDRFPLYLVATYPGDHELFAGAGFRSWLPEDLPVREATLGEVMEMG
jgi:GT2 family glycosyltransferase